MTFPKKSLNARRRLGFYRDRWSGTEFLFVRPILRHLDRNSFEIILAENAVESSDRTCLTEPEVEDFFASRFCFL
jgi:hypothetical protein